MGTREALSWPRNVETKKDLYSCFINFQKAFDRVKHDCLMECLDNIGLVKNNILLVENIYWNQNVMIRRNTVIRNSHKERCKAGMYCLSPFI